MLCLLACWEAGHDQEADDADSFILQEGKQIRAALHLLGCWHVGRAGQGQCRMKQMTPPASSSCRKASESELALRLSCWFAGMWGGQGRARVE